MKKYFSFLLVAVLVLGLFATSVFAADLKVGKVEWAAHGTKCFTVAFVVLDGDTIIRLSSMSISSCPRLRLLAYLTPM